MTAEDWTEKYRPQSLKDIVGNPTSAESMRQWALSWQKGIPKYRAMALIGTPGIGKTSAAEALARDMGWGIIEMNASDQRTGPAIENVAGRAAILNLLPFSFFELREAGVQLVGDLAYFLLNFSSMVFGDKIKRIQSSCVFTPMRVDRQLNITLQFKDDRMAVLSCTTSGNGESRAVIQGTKGYMVIENLMNFETITVYGSKRNKTGFYKRPKQKNEYEFELVAFIAAMKAGWKECPEIPHAQSVSIMHMMDFIRRAVQLSHVEITTLIVTGENDSEEEMREEAKWIRSLTDSKGNPIGKNIPLHVSRFFPRFHMTDREAAEVRTVYRLADIARKELNYVYTGNC